MQSQAGDGEGFEVNYTERKRGIRISVKVFSFIIFLFSTINSHALGPVTLTTNTHAQEQISLLKFVPEWNKWRESNPKVIPNFRKAELFQAILIGANLEKANLEDADLIGVDLERANLVKTNLVKADLFNANLRMSNLESANLQSANLQWANLEEADLIGANLNGANLGKAKNLSCKQLSLVQSFDSNTQFPKYLRLTKIREKVWKCKELK